MPNNPPLDRRQWLKAAGLAVAGATLAPRLSHPAAGIPADRSASHPDDAPAAPSLPDRHSVHGAEIFPIY